MAWVKLDDRFFDNQKIRRAGKDGRELYLSALTYSASALTDGMIHQDDVNYLAARAEVSDVDTAVNRLLSVGLWERTEYGYTIHDYHEYNPSAAQVNKQRQQNTERQAKWQAEHRGEDGRYQERSNTVNNGVSNGGNNGVSNNRPVPVPVPVPVPNSPSRSKAGTEQRKARITPERQKEIYAIFAAYCDGMGIDPKTVPKDQRGADLKAATQLLEAGYTPEQVKLATEAKRSDPWWQDKDIFLRHVASSIAQPKVETRSNGSATRQPERISRNEAPAGGYSSFAEFNARHPAPNRTG
jgi:hypothetical protein